MSKCQVLATMLAESCPRFRSLRNVSTYAPDSFWMNATRINGPAPKRQFFLKTNTPALERMALELGALLKPFSEGFYRR